jgi:hypothetical protein
LSGVITPDAEGRRSKDKIVAATAANDTYGAIAEEHLDAFIAS